MGDMRPYTSERRRTRWKKPCRWAPGSWATVRVTRLGKWIYLGYCPRVGYYPIGCCDEGRYSGITNFGTAPDVLAMKKRTALPQVPDGTLKALVAMDSVVMSRLPNLLSHCAVVRYDDGTPRMPGMLMLKTLGASWVVVLKDQDAGLQMQCVATSVDDALALADLQAGSDEAPWEVDPWAQKRAQGKSVKK